MSKDREPLLSVIVTAYNHEAFIGKCLDSILMQKTDFPFEIIVGEDDSTDRTREICLEYAGKYPDQIRLLLHRREDNILIDGKPTGRHNLIKCLEAARGKYFASIDGDDFLIVPNKFQRQVEFLEVHPEFALCCHPVQFVNSAGRQAKANFKFGMQRQPEANILDYAAGKVSLYKVSCVFRKQLDHLPEWFKKAPVADVPLYYLIGQYGKIKMMEEPMAAYRFHSSGQYTGLSTAAKYAMGFRVRKFIYDHAGEFQTDVRRALSGPLKLFAYLAAKHYYLAGDADAGKEYHRWFLKLAWADPKYLLHQVKLFFHRLQAGANPGKNRPNG